jgi:glycosyltransferase involved in cell wall biosynthesis
MQKRVAHLTSVHSHTDVRIFHKECKSLAALGYEVKLVAPGAPDGLDGGVRLIGTDLPRDRRDRVFNVTRRIHAIAKELDADLYHFHDPELMPVGVLLKLAGKKVVYDVHEEVVNDILDKDWIPAPLRRIVAGGVGLFENACARCYDGIVITRPSLYKHFDPGRTVLVHNYPILGELNAPVGETYAERPCVAAYVGGGTPERGIRELVQALGLLPETCPLELHFAGTITPAAFLDELRQLPGWQRVRYLGWLDRAKVAAVLGRSRMGMVTFLPIANHMKSEPTKLFEYMSARLPVVASNIPHWEKMVAEGRYGLVADPQDPAAIAKAMLDLLASPVEAEAMGARGYEAVVSSFNWDVACANLSDLYARILG